MKISIIGTGYVGLVTGTCFAEMGNFVICIDNDKRKIKQLKNGILPIFEPGLETLVKNNYKKGNLNFDINIKTALEKSNICFIAVGTPMNADGSACLKHVLSVAKSIGQSMTHHLYIVDKSTVPVGTADIVKQTIQNELDKRKSKLTFDVISNPEFLKAGTAINDCLNPERIIIGTDNNNALEIMIDLYKPFIENNDKFITMDIRSAEMTKYSANAMLATKISFINEIANICEKVDADINKVRIGIGSDSRIGYSFINPGCGYGGSCLPKDIQALIKTSKKHGYVPKILKSVEDQNYAQKKVLSQKVIQRFGKDLSTRTFAIWGLAFKPDTDDMREASSITIINELTSKGAKIKAYDPKAIHNAKNIYLKNNLNIEYIDNKYKALYECDALLLITEWKEFSDPDFKKIGNNLKNRIIFDGRNQYTNKALEKMGFEYYQIGV